VVDVCGTSVRSTVPVTARARKLSMGVLVTVVDAVVLGLAGGATGVTVAVVVTETVAVPVTTSADPVPGVTVITSAVTGD
jgi:multisubunit Na+/H+ antiporter MnhC subunit